MFQVNEKKNRQLSLISLPALSDCLIKVPILLIICLFDKESILEGPSYRIIINSCGLLEPLINF
jgi:hypothetical protein